MKRIWPTLVVLSVSLLFVGWRLVQYGGDPMAIAEIGSRYAELDPGGTEGYDGQFSVYIALDPDPESVAPHLDVPAYRYQRILYPLFSRVVAVGIADWIPWSLIAVNVFAQAVATQFLVDFLRRRSLPVGYALIYGLWVGLLSAVGLDLHEPVAYGLIVVAFFLRDRERYVPMGILLGLALFAKETTALFWLAILISDLIGRKLDYGHAVLIAGGLLFGFWQLWLWQTFGEPGIGSGGNMATPFEWIPFMGFIRIGFVSLKALGLFFLIFGPTIIFPTIYTLFQGVRRLRLNVENGFAWSSLLNAASIVVLPFSTFREPLGLVRMFTGVVLAFLLLNADSENRKNLNYALFWIAMLALLVNP